MIKITQLMLLFLCAYSSVLAQGEMTILSYNTLDGHFKDSIVQKKYVNWVSKIHPDIIAYQEMNKFTQNVFEKFAGLYQHPYAVLLKDKGYPVAISSKYPIVNVRKVTDNMHHGFIYAQIKDLHIFVIHLSPFSHQKRFEELSTVLAHVAILPDTAKVIIMGDFNAFSRKDTLYYGADLLESRKRRDEKYHQNNLNDGELDYSVTDLISSSEFIDTYWLYNDTFKNTLPTHISKLRVKRRIDYIWTNKILSSLVEKSGIIHDHDTDNLSDHYPVFINILQ